MAGFGLRLVVSDDCRLLPQQQADWTAAATSGQCRIFAAVSFGLHGDGMHVHFMLTYGRDDG